MHTHDNIHWMFVSAIFGPAQDVGIWTWPRDRNLVWYLIHLQLAIILKFWQNPLKPIANNFCEFFLCFSQSTKPFWYFHKKGQN